MDTSPERALTELAKGELLRIADGGGKAVAVFRGRAWIHRDGAAGRRVLAAGESLALDESGAVDVRALDDTALLVIEAVPA